MFRVAANSAVEEAGVGATMDVTMQASMAAAACKSLGNSNPFKDCIKECGTKNPKNHCIIQEGCYDKDENGKPIYEDKSLKEECYDNIMTSGVDYEALKVNLLYKDVPQGVAEAMAKSYLTKGVLKETTESAAAMSTKESTKRLAELSKKIRNVASNIYKNTMRTAIGKAGTVGIKLAGVAGTVGIKLAGVAGARATALQAAIRSTMAKYMIRTVVAKTTLVKSVKVMAMSMATLIAGAGVVLGVVDGVAIILSLWDPGGWENTVDKEMVDSTHSAYLKQYRKIFDNKVLFSEMIKDDRNKAKSELSIAKTEYQKNKSTKNKERLDKAEIQLEAVEALMFKFQWKSKDRPVAHGGPILWPHVATPEYPFKENGEWSAGLEDIYYKYIQDFMDEHNLVWTEDELSEDKLDNNIEQLNKKTEDAISNENKKIKKITNKSSYNIKNDEIKILKTNIEKNKKLSSKIDLAIKDTEDRINRYESLGKTEKANELKKTLDQLNKNKEKTDKLISDKTDIIKEVDESKQNASMLLSKKRKSRQAVFGLLVIITFLAYLYYNKKKVNKKVYY